MEPINMKTIADRDLQRLVAEAAGWTNLNLVETWCEGFNYGNFHDLLIGNDPDGEPYMEVPPYWRNLSACFHLFPGPRAGSVLEVSQDFNTIDNQDRWRAVYRFDYNAEGIYKWSTVSPERALLAVFLTWKEVELEIFIY